MTKLIYLVMNENLKDRMKVISHFFVLTKLTKFL